MNENNFKYPYPRYSICSKAAFISSFLPHKKSIRRKSSCIHIYFTCRTCQLNLHNSFHFEAERIRIPIRTVFCECTTYTRKMHTTHTAPCIIDIWNIFEEALTIQKLNNNSTRIYNMDNCVGNPVNLIIDHVNYWKTAPTTNRCFVRAYIFLEWDTGKWIAVCGLLSARNRLMPRT